MKQTIYDNHPFDEYLDMLTLLIKKHIELIEITRNEMTTAKTYEHYNDLLMRLIEHHKSAYSLFQHIMELTGGIELSCELQARFPQSKRLHHA